MKKLKDIHFSSLISLSPIFSAVSDTKIWYISLIISESELPCLHLSKTRKECAGTFPCACAKIFHYEINRFNNIYLIESEEELTQIELGMSLNLCT